MNTTTPETPCMSRKELANKYKMTDKLFRNRLKQHELHFGSVRILLPAQIEQIIEAFGHWDKSRERP